jgi:hypothetical protein
MQQAELTAIVERVASLVVEHYVFPDVATAVSRTLTTGLAEGRYPAGEQALAAALTADLQSVNSDKHLRPLHHAQPLPERHGEDDTDLATMTAWADQTCAGIASLQRLPANVGYLDLQPVLFPTAVCGAAIGAAMSLLAATEALIIDLRACLGGEPTMVSFLCSYLFGPEPVELTGLYERSTDRIRQH